MSRRAWTTGDLQRLQELRAQGKTLTEIALAMKRTAAAIATRLNKLRIARGVSAGRGRRVAPATDISAIDAFLRKPLA